MDVGVGIRAPWAEMESIRFRSHVEEEVGGGLVRSPSLREKISYLSAGTEREVAVLVDLLERRDRDPGAVGDVRPPGPGLGPSVGEPDGVGRGVPGAVDGYPESVREPVRGVAGAVGAGVPGSVAGVRACPCPAVEDVGDVEPALVARG